MMKREEEEEEEEGMCLKLEQNSLPPIETVPLYLYQSTPEGWAIVGCDVRLYLLE